MEGELNTDTKLLSIIIPCYNEEQAIPLFYQETMKQEFFFREKGVELEFIFVNDGSKDGTVEAVKELHKQACASNFFFEKFWERSSNFCRA